MSRITIRKGMRVKILDADRMDMVWGDLGDYGRFLKQIAGKVVTISRLRKEKGVTWGRNSCFEVEGVDDYPDWYFADWIIERAHADPQFAGGTVVYHEGIPVGEFYARGKEIGWHIYLAPKLVNTNAQNEDEARKMVVKIHLNQIESMKAAVRRLQKVINLYR